MWLRRCAVLVTTVLAHRHVELHEWGVHDKVGICSWVALEVGDNACIPPVFSQQYLGDFTPLWSWYPPNISTPPPSLLYTKPATPLSTWRPPDICYLSRYPSNIHKRRPPPAGHYMKTRPKCSWLAPGNVSLRNSLHQVVQVPSDSRKGVARPRVIIIPCLSNRGRP